MPCGGRRGEVTPPYGCNTGDAQRRADVGIGPYGKKSKPHQPPGPAAHSEAFTARMGENRWESRQRSSPKGPSTPDNPSVSLRLTAPFTQGSLRDGGCGLPRRFAPRNDSPKPLSFRGGPTGRRGNPSFYDGQGFGPPRSSAPTESPINHPSQPARSEAFAPAAARDGRESAQRPSQKGAAPATAWAALSEAESAGIIAGQIQVLPDDLRVQHGVLCSEV